MSDTRFKWTSNEDGGGVAEFPVNGKALLINLATFGDAVSIDRALQTVFSEGQVAGLRSAKAFINASLAKLPAPVEVA